MQTVADVLKIDEPAERARKINALIDEHQAEINELSRLRKDALDGMLASGMSQTQIANLLGMSKGRVSQLLSAGLRPERAFLGTGRLTVAIGAKIEANRSDPSHVLSAESFNAYERIAAAARLVGLDAGNEVVPPPGNVDLNRPNLVVMTNPRLLPFLGQVMGADPNLRYLSDERGWYILDQTTGTEYRSPRDAGESADYAYVGRLPRPDGKGTFLYLAGTHAPGTLGAACYLADNLSDLYKELKTRRFSTVIKCQYEPGNQLLITSTERVAPLYRHEG